MKLAIALISEEGDVQKASSIHKATLHCMLLRTLSGYESEALL